MLTSRVISIQKNSLINGANDVGSKTNVQEVSDVKSIGLLTVPILIQYIYIYRYVYYMVNSKGFI